MKVIVSGASSGIGKELAIAFSKKGFDVLAIARSKDKLQNLKLDYDKIQILSCDLSKDESRDSFESALSAWEKIDIIINNAGQLLNKPFLESTTNDFLDMFNVNVLSSVRLIQWSYSRLEKSDSAHIVNISSMGGFQGSSKFSGLSAYSSAKGALTILTECIASETNESDIRVNALALGAVDTLMLNRAFPGYKAPLSPSKMASYIAEFALSGGVYYHGKVLPVALGNP